jgi:hypothetical protein
MVGSLMKMLAHSRATRSRFVLRHPVKAFRLGKLRHDLRHAPAPRVAAMGAAALALPIGFLLARRGNHRNGASR